MKNLVPHLFCPLILLMPALSQPVGAQQEAAGRFGERQGAVGDDRHAGESGVILVADDFPEKPAARLVSANNRFGFELYHALLKQGVGKNLLFSPTSIALALEMTWNGAARQTAAAMAGALQLQGMSSDAVNKANSSLLADLNARKGVQLKVSNSLWVGKATQIKPEFIQQNKTFYQAEIGDLAGAPGNVNDWVNRQTNGKIKDILSKSDVPKDLTSLILANVVYFKGPWLHPFSAPATKTASFTRPDGTKTTCQMMTSSASYPYYQGSGFQAVSLPFGDKGSSQVSMILLLPDESSSLAKLEQSMTEANWNQWMQKLASQRGTVDLPRFRFDYGVDLKPPLKSLGMGPAFDPMRADFSNMSRAKEYIGVVKHKTYISVDEKGAEAAAATAVGMFTRAMPVEKPFHITFNRPFACVLRDDVSGAILFLGSVADPLVK